MQTLFRGNHIENIRSIHLEADPRFSYSLLMPRQMDDRTKLIVAVHGSERDPIAAMARFRDLAPWHNVAILAPMFPRFADDVGDLVGYKMLRWRGINYDEVLLSMVAEAHERYGTPAGKFALSGYSGGGQFVERFSLFHAARLLCASIGAPGRVTLPTLEEPWWIGVADAKRQLGLAPDLDALRNLAVQIVVGNLDIGEGYEVPRESEIWRENLDFAGTTRRQRAATLYEALRAMGSVNARLDIVDGQAHECPGAFDAMKLFIIDHLRRE